MNIDLTKKRALVAGSTRGIGKATAMELAELGADVTLIARDDKMLEAVKNELPCKAGQHHDWICADFTDAEALREKINLYMIGKTIHILVNNTGGPKPGLAIDARTAEFTEAYSQHLLCNHILSQAVIEGMKREGYGRIINIISISVKAPLKNLGVSNTTRFAVAGWAKSLAQELGEFGITVNNVLPGYTATSRLSSLLENNSRISGISVEKLKEQLFSEIPARRFADPSETANAVAFLASPAAAYINGINLPVDGGKTVCL